MRAIYTLNLQYSCSLQILSTINEEEFKSVQHQRYSNVIKLTFPQDTATIAALISQLTKQSKATDSGSLQVLLRSDK